MFDDSSKSQGLHTFSRVQRAALGLMTGLACLTFLMTNLQALLWQSSDWLVSTVLPAVVIDLTNNERADLSAAPLRRNATLDEAARQKAEHMAQNEYFAHYSPDGVSPWHWFKEVDYVYAHAGENLAIHFTDSAQVVDAWMNSPTHRENIVNGLYSEIGVGTARGSFEGYDTVYVVQLFGAPASVPATRVQSPIEVTETTTTVDPLPPLETQVSGVQDSSDVTSPSEDAAKHIIVVPANDISEPETGAVISVTEAATGSKLSKEYKKINIVPESPTQAVIVTKPLLATSSGFAIANIEEPHATHAGATVASIATRPHQLLQFIYITMAIVTLLLIGWSIIHEARRLHFVQVAYGVLLLFVMGMLWLVHGTLTTGAVVI